MTSHNPDRHTYPHRCLICNSDTSPYFSKAYPTYPGSPFADDLIVRYRRCPACGFVFSQTHREMSVEQWSRLNHSWHMHFESGRSDRIANQPPYADQALAMHMLSRNGLLDMHDALDYAAGFGTLSRFLSKYFNVDIEIYDRYVRSQEAGLRYIEESSLRRYRLVINSAMFEHVLDRESLDEVDRLVARDGVLMLHTVLCERVPPDPEWFYLEPVVHTAFHTNRSMARLMEQWGYAASVYAPQAKSWFLFRQGYPGLERLESTIASINDEVQTNYFYYKQGFVDYWKGFDPCPSL